MDAAGDAYVAGRTLSSTFPRTPGAHDVTFGVSDAFDGDTSPDGAGGACTGAVRVGVPRRRTEAAVDDGRRFDSLRP